jgi:putative membrane protein
MFYMHGAGWGWWLLMSIGMVAFWGLIIYGIVLLARGQTNPVQPSTRESSAEILKRRLAAGEISIEEYERLRETLEEAPHKPIAA